jgi:hypothetical protein
MFNLLRMRILCTLFGLLLFLCARPLAAQESLISDPVSIRNDYGYEIIGRLRDKILLFRDRFDEFEVQAYDQQMRLSWSKEMSDLGRHGTQILAVVGAKNDFSVIYKQRKRGRTLVRIHKYDPSANLIDSMTIKDYGDQFFSSPELDVVQSEDRSCILVYNNANKDNLGMVCFQMDKMTVLWERSVVVEYDLIDTEVESMVLNNSGQLFLTTQHDNRRTRMESHLFRIWQISAATDRTIIVPLPDFLSVSAKFAYDEVNKQLVICGLYSEKNRERANGTYYIRLKPEAADDTYQMRYEPFDDKFVSILRQKDVEDDNRGINYANVTHMVLRQDGGALLVVERHHEIQRGATAGRGFWREGVRLIVDYYYDDLFVIGIHPDGRVHWRTVLHKKQYSQDDDGTFSSFFMMRNTDKLHFLFNDEIKYDNTCSEYLLSPLGAFDRNSLLNTVGLGLRLRFRDGIQINANECLIPSEFRNKLRLVLMRFQ